MNLKEQLVKKSDIKIIDAANSLANILKPKLISSAEKGFQSLKVNLQDMPDFIEPYLQFIGSEKFIKELSYQLDDVSIRYEQAPRYLSAFGTKSLVGHTPYLIIDWGTNQ